MSGIFVSYRRNDSQSAAGRVTDCLERSFGREQIFRDVETLEPGVDFVDAIDRAIESSQVMLVVIGPRWHNITDSDGKRRLEKDGDWIRLETATALQRNLRVIPLLVEGAQPPVEADLPDDIKGLARREAHELSDKRWDYDVEKLIEALERIPGIRRRGSPRPPPEKEKVTSVSPPAATSKVVKTFAWIGGVFVGLIVLGLLINGAGNQTPPPMQPVVPLPIQSTPAAARLPAGSPTSACGCWGYATAGVTQPNLNCASGMHMAQMCRGTCPAGGSTWQTVCR